MAEEDEYEEIEVDAEEDEEEEDDSAPSQNNAQMVAPQQNQNNNMISQPQAQPQYNAEDKKSIHSKKSKVSHQSGVSRKSGVSKKSGVTGKSGVSKNTKQSQAKLSGNKKIISSTNNNANSNVNTNTRNIPMSGNYNNTFKIPNPEEVTSARSYLESTVTTVIQEALFELVRAKPSNPLEFVGNYILNRAHGK